MAAPSYCKSLPLVSARHAAVQAKGRGTPGLCSFITYGRRSIINHPCCIDSNSINGSNYSRRIIKHSFCINHGVPTADAYIIRRHLRPHSFFKADHVHTRYWPPPHSGVSIRGICSSTGHDDDRRHPRKIPPDGEGSVPRASNDHSSVASTPSDYCDPAQKHSTGYAGRTVDAPDAIHDAASCSCPCHDVPRGTGNSVLKESPAEKEGWQLLRAAMVYYCGSPVGTIAASDPTDPNPLNYDQVFIRDFIPSAIAFLLKGEVEIVRNFLLHTLQLQSWEKTVDWFSPGQGLMPASFKVRVVPREAKAESPTNEETLDPDFGEAAIGRVAPVDSGLWWIILLRAYGKCTGDLSLQQRIDVQTGVKMVLKLCLEDGFDMFPTLLVTDGSCMIDRRMGIHGHPLEIQALFYSALRCAREMLPADDTLSPAISNRLLSLSFHIREYYWLDMKRLNTIYRYKTEEYSHEAVNKFNIYPDQIPAWLVDWMPDRGGYLIGNLQPAHMDFRFFSLGNLWSIVGSLATPEQSHAILDLIEAKWTDLVGSMPLKICYPALVDNEWQIITGSDPKNTPWSYHNGGSWPTLLWQLTVACLKMKRPDLACKAVGVAEERLAADKWPEYYDLRSGKFVGKQARLHQTWTIAGFLVARQLLRSPEAVHTLALGYDDSDTALLQARSRYNRGKRNIVTADTSSQIPPTIPPPFPPK